VTRVAQRCACGGHAPPGGECAQCRARRLAAESIARTVRAPGRPLDAPVRASFERRWGHDFRNVRVHSDDDAARSAEAIGAQAYTFGRDVVFGRDRYDPTRARGRQLLAHELTHVRQQAGRTSSGAPAVLDDPRAEAEADRSPVSVQSRVPPGVQRQPLGEDPFRVGRLHIDPIPPPMLTPPGSIRETYILPAPPDVRLEGPRLDQPRERFPRVLEGQLQGPPPFTPAIFIPVARCVPDRALTWADFQGTPVGSFGAFTRVPITEENVQGNVMFRAIMDNAGSWVRPKFAGAGARATNGCATRVAQCHQAFAGGGASWTWTPAPGCPAGIDRPARATTDAECEDVVGAQCDADAPLESERLLRHEQGHFDITCKLVGRADDALIAGRPLDTVRTWVNAHVPARNTMYDNQTTHGCNAGQQATWETAISNGLPAVPAP
jgi:hypothetical protein